MQYQVLKVYHHNRIIKLPKKIAIANKESIICGWNLINKELKKIKLSLYHRLRAFLYL